MVKSSSRASPTFSHAPPRPHAGSVPHMAGARIRVERFPKTLPESLSDLLAEDAHAGTHYVQRLVAEWVSGANRFDRPGEALFGAWVGEQLVGVCGLNVDPYAEGERTGRVRRLYVLKAYRRLGVGRRLVMEVIAAARDRFD